jgi:hypothetical protein
LYDLLKRITNLRQALLNETPNIPFDALIILFKGCVATDPRDMVCGVLGLATGRISESIKVDYEKTVVQVCGEAAYSIIANAIERLDYLAMSRAPKNLQEVPSWCPNLSAVSKVVRGSVGRAGPRSGLIYSACKYSKGSFRFSKNLSILTVVGCCEGIITELGDIMPDVSDMAVQMSEYESKLE